MCAAFSTGLDGFEAEAAAQCTYFESRSRCHAAFLGMAASLLAEAGDVREAVLAAWNGRSFRARFERPLLLCAAVRFDALQDPGHPLWAGLAREPPDIDAIQIDAVQAALLRPSALASMSGRFVQTNEVTRACVWRLPLGIVSKGRPCILVDLGCSAGLNLIADRLNLNWTNLDNVPLVLRPARILRRIGFDRAPVDVRDQDAATWLRACIWPGQTERLHRFELALQCAREALKRGEMQLESADATQMPLRLETLVTPDAMIFAYQTVVLDYLVPPIRDTYKTAMREWVLAHPRRVVWAEFERSAAAATIAEIRVHYAMNGVEQTRILAEGEYHPETLRAHEGALAQLTADFAAS
jgi:hypothetical protein